MAERRYRRPIFASGAIGRDQLHILCEASAHAASDMAGRELGGRQPRSSVPACRSSSAMACTGADLSTASSSVASGTSSAVTSSSTLSFMVTKKMKLLWQRQLLTRGPGWRSSLEGSLRSTGGNRSTTEGLKAGHLNHPPLSRKPPCVCTCTHRIPHATAEWSAAWPQAKPWARSQAEGQRPGSMVQNSKSYRASDDPRSQPSGQRAGS